LATWDAPQELGRVLFVGFARRKVRLPILLKQSHDIIADFARQCLIGFMPLHPMKNRRRVESDPFVDEGLSDKIVRCVVEVFGGNGSTIYRLLAEIALVNDMLFNEMHPQPPVP
jgi:hypothetical protein